MTEFAGFPVAALDFYDDLEVDNTKSYWEKHKATYDNGVKAPITALVAALAPEFGEPQDLPALPRRPVRQGQDAVQDQPGRVRRGRSGHRLVRRDLGARRTHRRRLLRACPATGWPPSATRSPTTGSAPAGAGRQQADQGRLGDRRRPAQDRAARVSRRPQAHRAAPPQAADRRALLGFEQVIHTPELLDVVRADWRALRPLIDWLGAATDV